MQKRGLVNTKGGRVCKNGITKILKNPFYIGIMKVKGQTFEGNHKPLITTQIFKKTQLIIKGRQNTKGLKHNYLFRIALVFVAKSLEAPLAKDFQPPLVVTT